MALVIELHLRVRCDGGDCLNSVDMAVPVELVKTDDMGSVELVISGNRDLPTGWLRLPGHGYCCEECRRKLP